MLPQPATAGESVKNRRVSDETFSTCAYASTVSDTLYVARPNTELRSSGMFASNGRMCWTIWPSLLM
jgi:hypothetical protein